MSKIGNHRVEMQESHDYHFGWASADRGQPLPIWNATSGYAKARLARQCLGWQDHHDAASARGEG